MKVPLVCHWREAFGVRATFALSLHSIQAESFRDSPYDASDMKIYSEVHRRNVNLVNIIARWPHPISCELHIHSKPSLIPEIPGENVISMAWHVQAPNEGAASEWAISDALMIEPLLKSFWPFGEWAYAGRDQIQECLRPFTPHSALSVCHHRKQVSPVQPFVLERTAIGYRGASTPEARAASDIGFEYSFPWVPSFGEEFPMLLESLLNLTAPRWIVIRIGHDSTDSRRQRTLKRLEDTIIACERFLARADSGQITLAGQAQAILDASLRQYARIQDSSVLGAVLGQCITGDHGRRQVESLFEGGYAVREVDPELSAKHFEFPTDDPWSAEEAAGAFRVPLLDDRRNLGLRVQRCRTIALQAVSNSGSVSGTRLGMNVHRGVCRPVEIELKDRLHHMLCIGATGVGKSTMLLNCMLQDANAGLGFTLIDPPGELADDLLARFPKTRADDLIVIDLEDRDYPVPLNLLAWRTVEERDLIIDTLYTTLLSIYKSPDFFGPVFEQYFRSGLRLFMGDRPCQGEFVPTLIEFPQVLRNKEFRNHLKRFLQDEEVRDIADEADKIQMGENTLTNVAPYITSKFNRFLQDSHLRRIVGHGSLALDFRHAMDSGKIIVMKLAQGRFGKNATDILLAQLVARFRLAAMGRADTPSAQRRPYFLYIDEFQVLADANIAEMLSQCRKYSLGLVLVNQYVSQLRERGVLDSVLGNVGTIAAFRVGAEDARLLESVFYPHLKARDLIESPNWSGYMRLHSSREPLSPFSFKTLRPDSTSPDPEWGNYLRECSRRKWGVHREEVDKRIAARRKFIFSLKDAS